MNSRNLPPFKHLRLLYRARTLRKSRWRLTSTFMILWWRTSRRQRIQQGIPLPLLSSPPSRARCKSLWIARFRVEDVEETTHHTANSFTPAARKDVTSQPSKTQAVTRANTSTRSTRRATSAHHEQPEPATVQAPEAVISGEDSEEVPVETYFDLHDPLVEDVEETTHPTGNSFTPTRLATIESPLQFSVDRALQSFSISATLPFVAATPPYSGT